MQIHQDQTPIFSKFNNEFWYFRQFSIEISWPQMLSCETFELYIKNKNKNKEKRKKEKQESSQSNLNPISIILGITKIENKNCLISTIIGCRYCCRYAHYWQIQTRTILLSPRLLICTRPTKPSVPLPLELGLRNMRALDLISV